MADFDARMDGTAFAKGLLKRKYSDLIILLVVMLAFFVLIMVSALST